MTLVVAGVVILLAHFGNRWVLAYPFSDRNPATRLLPLMRRLNSLLGISGVVIVVMGLLFPSI